MQQKTSLIEDIFSFAQQLAEKARSFGDTETASALEAALRQARMETTVSEKLGTLRTAFLSVKERIGDEYSPETREQLQETLIEIDRAFEVANRGGCLLYRLWPF